MPSPIKPNTVLEKVASLDGDFCEKFIDSLNAPNDFIAWYKWKRNPDGTLTDEFKAMVCLSTAGTGGDTVTPPVTPPVIVPPAPPEPPVPPVLTPPYLTASRGQPARITLRWTPSPGANAYQVFRYGQPIVQLSALTFVDLVPNGRQYMYSVIAINTLTGLRSGPSNDALGYSGAIITGTPPIP